MSQGEAQISGKKKSISLEHSIPFSAIYNRLKYSRRFIQLVVDSHLLE